MEFVKKNVILTVMLSISGVAAIALIFFVVNSVKKMDVMRQSREQNIRKIRSLNKQEYSPVPGNVKNLTADKELLEHELKFTYRKFGAPLRKSFRVIAEIIGFETDPRLLAYKGKYKSIKELAKAIEKMNPKDKEEALAPFKETIKNSYSVYDRISNDVELRVLQRFSEFWKKQKNITPGTAVKKFLEAELKAVNNKKINATDLYSKVVKAFDASVDKVAVIKTVSGKDVKELVREEPIEDINDTIINAFGLPLTMDKSPRKCKDYMREFKSNILTSLNNPDLPSESQIAVKPAAENFTFDEFLAEDKSSVFPQPDQIPYIVEHWRAVSYIVSIIANEMKAAVAENKPASFDKFVRIGEIEGDEKAGFIKYTYEIEFSAPMDVVRKCINAIESSVNDSRVLVIKKLSLKKVTDGVKDYEKTLATIKDAVKRGAKEYVSKGLIDPRAPEAKEGYGWTIIGSDNVTANITIENVIYIGNVLKEKK